MMKESVKYNFSGGFECKSSTNNMVYLIGIFSDRLKTLL